MKTLINITGSGINSKRKLFMACSTLDAEPKQGAYTLVFPTKKQAIKALSEAYQHLHSDIEDWKNANASYYRGSSLSYDAGNAKICNFD